MEPLKKAVSSITTDINKDTGIRTGEKNIDMPGGRIAVKHAP